MTSERVSFDFSRPPRSSAEGIPMLFPSENLVDDLLKVKENGRIRMWIAEADCDLYNNPQVLEAIQSARIEKNATIQVITGPIIMVDDGGTNGILQLDENKDIITLAHERSLDFVPPYRLIEKEGYIYRIHEEMPSSIGTPTNKRTAVNMGNLSANEGWNYIENKKYWFDHRIESYFSYRFENHQRPMIIYLATRDQLTELTAMLSSENLPFFNYNALNKLAKETQLLTPALRW